jgi:hypothetical protein
MMIYRHAKGVRPVECCTCSPGGGGSEIVVESLPRVAVTGSSLTSDLGVFLR